MGETLTILRYNNTPTTSPWYDIYFDIKKKTYKKSLG